MKFYVISFSAGLITLILLNKFLFKSEDYILSSFLSGVISILFVVITNKLFRRKSSKKQH